MTLRINYDTPYGINCPQAICVVRDLRCNKEIDLQNADTDNDGQDEQIAVKRFIVSYNGKIYANQTAYDNDKSPIGGFNGSFELYDGDKKNHYNIVKQCYMNLKEQDLFADGIDL